MAVCILNPDDWNTICDLVYVSANSSCSEYWRTCNPANDLAARRPLQRGRGSGYLPNHVEVMTAIAAPSYDAADAEGKYSKKLLIRVSEAEWKGAWNSICSAVTYTGPRGTSSYVHNVVHLWVGGHMAIVPTGVNDPIFNFHHCNIGRIFESWIQWFAVGNSNPAILPAYVPASGGHYGHNRDCWSSCIACRVTGCRIV